MIKTVKNAELRELPKDRSGAPYSRQFTKFIDATTAGQKGCTRAYS
jgi:hypothetical protein